MEKMIFVFFLITGDVIGQYTEGNDINTTSTKIPCKTRYFLDNCLSALPEILQQSDTGLPTSKKDVDIICEGFKTGMKCIDEYSKTCLTSEQREHLENSIIGARYTFRFLCDDVKFQAEYLKYSTCLRGIKRSWDSCANQFVSLVKEELTRKNVSRVSRLSEICCARHGFINCILMTTKLKCRKEETIFVTKIADTLSNTRVYSPHCKSINVTFCKSHSNVTNKPSIFLTGLSIILYLLFKDNIYDKLVWKI